MRGTLINGVNFVNLTPHTVNVAVPGTDIVHAIPASGIIARAAQSSEPAGEIAGIPVVRTVYGEVSGIPAPEDGTIYIVSARTAQAVKNRDDVIIPGLAIHDQDGNVTGCSGFCRV